MRRNNFDRIAWIYDLLKVLLFGNTLDKAASRFFDLIPRGSRILIVGGGTGRLLQCVSHDHRVDFLEMSGPMLRKAIRRKSHPNLRGIQGDFLSFRGDLKYDVIVCPFFLDVFGTENLHHSLRKIQALLCSGGLLLVADFQDPRRPVVGRLFISGMYLFFRLFARIEGRKLLPIHQAIKAAGFEEKMAEFYYFDLVFSRIYQG